MRKIIPILRQWWYRNNPSDDEFGPCYSFDTEYFLDIRENAFYYQAKADEWWEMERWYSRDLVKRREEAHKKDMVESDSKTKN